jgi:hypothetical protein
MSGVRYEKAVDRVVEVQDVNLWINKMANLDPPPPSLCAAVTTIHASFRITFDTILHYTTVPDSLTDIIPLMTLDFLDYSGANRRIIFATSNQNPQGVGDLSVLASIASNELIVQSTQ